MKKIFMLSCFLLLCLQIFSEEKVLKADFRHRPPEMLISQNQELSGPLKDILEEAASRIGYSVKWRVAPFSRSLADLETGDIDIVPRVLKNKDRENFVNFLTPIGYQKKDILFLVKKGDEKIIKEYNDLYRLNIGVKRGTVYFDKFDDDSKINKTVSTDDLNLSKMFIAKRFDTMIVLDKKAIEAELLKNHFKDFSYAEYKYENFIGNYYGMSKKSLHSDIQDKLNKTFKNMISEGFIKEIYEKYDLIAPIQK